MPLNFTLKAAYTAKAKWDKGNIGTGTLELLLDGTVIARLNGFHVRFANQSQKYYIAPPSRSEDGVDPQTGQPTKRWINHWEFLPADRQVHDGWTQSIVSEFFRQLPDAHQKWLPDPVGAQHGGYGQQAHAQASPGGAGGTYGVPVPAGPPMPGPGAAAPPQAAPQAPAPVPGGYGAPPAPPAGPPAGGYGAPAYGAAPPVPTAPGAPPMPAPGAPAFAPQPARPPAPPPGPTTYMPANPSFPLPG